MLIPQRAKPKTLDDLILEVDYYFMNNEYVPSIAAVTFVNFIKLVNGAQGEENKSPVIHMDMIDKANKYDDNLYVSFRGSAKTTALHEYMFLYIATYGDFFDFGEVKVAMYISDTIDNGVKSMRKNLEFRWNNSEFLQEYVPIAKFTDVRWEFENLEGKRFCVRGFGATTGVRGFKEYGLRPTWCGFDDLMSDKNASSPTIISDMRSIIYKAARQAMHPKKRKIIWTGTPFNQRDPLYQAAATTAWTTTVYPICEKFPCKKSEFRGAWEDRFPYEFVKKEYDKLLEAGEIAAFNQELMLRIMSDEDRVIKDEDIQWYNLKSLMKMAGAYTYFITTDFATSAEQAADFSVIMVWAVNYKGWMFLVDGVCKKQDMACNKRDLFSLVQKWNRYGFVQSVGVEVSGQQGGFVSLIKDDMIDKNIFFNFASEGNKNKEGIRPTTDKMQRFNIVLPWFRAKMILFPEELRNTDLLIETNIELSLLSKTGYKSKNDDCGDCIAMLGSMPLTRPSQVIEMTKNYEGIYQDYSQGADEYSAYDSYLV